MAGLFWGVPNAVFTMVLYPLRNDVPRHRHELGAGGVRTLLLRLVFGAVVGATCGATRQRRF